MQKESNPLNNLKELIGAPTLHKALLATGSAFDEAVDGGALFRLRVERGKRRQQR
jgi:hypothetical protein